MKTIAFFNNKGGVGKTSLVYHPIVAFGYWWPTSIRRPT